MVPSKGLRLTLFKIMRETFLRVKCSFRVTASRDSEIHVFQTSILSPQFFNLPDLQHGSRNINDLKGR